MTELLDPYQFEFFRNGLMVATIAGTRARVAARRPGLHARGQVR